MSDVFLEKLYVRGLLEKLYVRGLLEKLYVGFFFLNCMSEVC
jgi:hypothetical protein